MADAPQKVEYKGYYILGDRTYGMKIIRSMGAGVLPAELDGMFTKSMFAEQAIDRYVARKDAEEAAKAAKPKKVKLDAPAERTG